MEQVADLWPAGLAVVAAILVSSILSGLRSAIARLSRPRPHGPAANGTPDIAPTPPRRARILGGLLVASIALTIGATVLAAHVMGGRFGATGALSAALLMIGLVVFAEAVARLAAVQAAIARSLRPLSGKVDRYAALLSPSEEIRDRVDRLHEGGGVVKEDVAMLGGLLDLKELSVSSVMVHRTKLRMLDADLPPDEMAREVLSSPYTRMPLWRDSPENIIGVLHAKNLWRALGSSEGGRRAVVNVEQLASAPWFVPDTTSLRDQLAAFLARRQHVALVVDEYGDLMGLLTLEDILEEIVGEISDEHDVTAAGLRPQRDGSMLVDGSLPVRDLNRVTGWDLPEDEATTVAGLVIHEAMLIPEAGQVFNFRGFRFEVLRRVRNRLAALKVAPSERVDPLPPAVAPPPPSERAAPVQLASTRPGEHGPRSRSGLLFRARHELRPGEFRRSARPTRRAPRRSRSSTTRPAWKTRMRSALRMVARRCAITKVVRPFITLLQRDLELALGCGVERARRLVEDEGRADSSGSPSRSRAADARRRTASARARR